MSEIAEFTRIEIEEISTREVAYKRGGKSLTGESIVVKTMDGETMSLAPWEPEYADSRKALLTKKPCDVVIEQKGEFQNIKLAKVATEGGAHGRVAQAVGSVSSQQEKESTTSVSRSIPDRTRQILIIRQSCLKAAIDLMSLPNFPQERLEGGDPGAEFKSEEQLAIEIARYFERQYVLAGVEVAAQNWLKREADVKE